MLFLNRQVRSFGTWVLTSESAMENRALTVAARCSLGLPRVDEQTKLGILQSRIVRRLTLQEPFGDSRPQAFFFR